MIILPKFWGFKSKICFSFSSQASDRHKNLLYYEGIIQDITRRKEEEQALLYQIEEMQIAIDRAKQANEVAQIVGTNSFEQVKQKIKKLKNQNRSD